MFRAWNQQLEKIWEKEEFDSRVCSDLFDSRVWTGLPHLELLVQLDLGGWNRIIKAPPIILALIRVVHKLGTPTEILNFFIKVFRVLQSARLPFQYSQFGTTRHRYISTIWAPTSTTNLVAI